VLTVNVRLEQDTTAPDTMLVVLRITLAADVPTEPSNHTVVPLLARMRAHVAVPVALAEESSVMALAVMTPPDAAPNASAPKRSSARRT
jgi:hypothetical protein